MILEITLLATGIIVLAITNRERHDEIKAEISDIKSRLQELERAVVRDECVRNDYVYTTRRATTIDME